MFKLKLVALAAAFAALGGMATAQSWTLNGEASKVAFGSIKSNEVGEVHSFSGLSGSAQPDGTVMVEIDLSTVETLIDIRNERMVEYVFQNVPKAVINAEIEMEEVNGLGVGESTVVEAFGSLTLVGNELDIDAEMYVLRVSETQVMVTTNDMIMLSTEEIGINAGVDKLMELAELPSITRVSPVTLRLMFDLDVRKADAQGAARAQQAL